ncbi:MAG TPA: glucosaminidase domain-containing protein [Polyangiaceae bacterium]
MVVLPPLSNAPAAIDRARETPSASGTDKTGQFSEILARAAPGARPLPGTVVTPVATYLSSGQASESIARAWRDVFGEEPPPGAVGILTAQWAHETASGASMYNYNFAGIKGAGPQGFSVAQKTREGFGATERRIVDHFRAYSSADEGAVDYVKLLSARYPDAVAAAKDGNAPAFVHALKAHGYFTGSEQAYTRSIVALSGGDPSSLGTGDGFDARPLDYASQVGAPGVGMTRGFRFSGPSGAGASAPFVDSVAMADELSRTALRIAADPGEDRRSEST